MLYMMRGMRQRAFTAFRRVALSVEGVLAAVARSRDGFLNVLFVRA
jgi:hypothetical protein